MNVGKSVLALVLALVSSAVAVGFSPAVAQFRQPFKPGMCQNVEVGPHGSLRLGRDPTYFSEAYRPFPWFGLCTSDPEGLGRAFDVVTGRVEVVGPTGTRVELEVRAARSDGLWSTWQTIPAGGGRATLPFLASRLQYKLTLSTASLDATPVVSSVSMETGTDPTLLSQRPLATYGNPTVRIWATREGLVGNRTANGHTVAQHDHFVALPSRRSLSSLNGHEYQVRITYKGKSAVAPVWDVGPWNIKDNYWDATRDLFNDLPRWLPEAQAAYFNNYNGGLDQFGRFVTVPAALDIADGTFWDDLGMTQSDWVDVTFLWLDAPSPPPGSTPPIVPKTPPATSSQTRAGSYVGSQPAVHVYLPLIMNNANGWTTTFTVQNPGDSPNTVSIDFYDAGGSKVAAQVATLQAYGSRTFDPSAVNGLPSGFVGSAVVTGQIPVAAVVNEDKADMDRMAYEGVVAGAPTVYAPLLFKGYHGWATGLQVQNLGWSPTRVQVTYFATAPAGGQWSDSAIIPPMASVTFYQPSNPSLPQGFVGSAVVRSLDGQPLAATVNEAKADGTASSYVGLTSGSAVLSAPLLFKNYGGGWSTGLQVQNLDTSNAEVSVVYRRSSEPGQWGDGAAIAAGGSATFYQPANGNLPDGFVGSATVSSLNGVPLGGIVNEVKYGTTAAMTYATPGSGALSVVLPLLTRNWNGWSTGAQVQNMGAATASVAISYYAQDGRLVASGSAQIEPGRSTTFYLPAAAGVPDGFIGSGIVSSTNGQPIAAIVNEVKN